jgi:hypothetical protein
VGSEYLVRCQGSAFELEDGQGLGKAVYTRPIAPGGATSGSKVVGIGEVCWRKGRTYSAVVSDLIRMRPIVANLNGLALMSTISA